MHFKYKGREITKIADINANEVSESLKLRLTDHEDYKDMELSEHLYSPYSLLEETVQKEGWRTEIIVELTAINEMCSKLGCAYFRILGK